MARTKAKPPLDPATDYARKVVDGEIVAGRLVRLACARHLTDLEHGAARGLRFDVKRAEKAIKFFGFLRLAEGEHAGKPFTLQPWQQFIVGSLFGWLGADGYRRFRKAYVEGAKGCGKSPLAAGVALLGLVADGEAAAEVYAAAVTRDQAGILWTDAKRMVEASPALARRITVNAHNLADLATSSFFRPISSEGRTLDGKRVHMALIDEVHEHPTPIVVEKMQAGTKGRRQPLIFEITNSGYDRRSVCWQHHEYSEKVLTGVIEDDGWFSYVCGLDEGDDYRDEACWPKANPNLDVSVTRKYLREQVREAQGMPSKENIVKRLNFCVWTENAVRWFALQTWDAGRRVIDWSDYRGRLCYGGLDLSSTMDVTALALLFPNDDGSIDVLCRFWVPEATVEERVRKNDVFYGLWRDRGLLRVTPGNVVDYDFIREEIRALRDQYQIKEVGYDPWNATGLIVDLLADGLDLVEVRQGYGSLSAPSKEFEKLVQGAKLHHDGDPVLRWMASNVATESDAAGNIKPSKDRSVEKIDGISAIVTALARLIVHGEERSVYEERGILLL